MEGIPGTRTAREQRGPDQGAGGNHGQRRQYRAVQPVKAGTAADATRHADHGHQRGQGGGGGSQDNVHLDERVVDPPDGAPILRARVRAGRAGAGRSGLTRSIGGLACLVLVGLGIAMAVMSTPPPDAPAVRLVGVTAQQTNGAAGRDLFLANCAACHGDQGQGTAAAATIVNAGPALTDFVLRTGRMPLPDINAPVVRRTPILTPEQIAALVAYVSSLGSGPQIPQIALSGADLALGRDLYIANCAACHGAGGPGGAVGDGFVAPNLSQADPLTVGEAVTAGPGPMPVFRFKAADLNAVIAYVQQLREAPSPGGLPVAEVGPVPEGFVAGFVGLVALLALVRWIGRRPAPSLPPILDADPEDDASDGAGLRAAGGNMADHDAV